MRFIIVSVLPPVLAKVVSSFRESLNVAAGTKEALLYPPHITLRTGIVCPDGIADRVAHDFLMHAEEASSATVRTLGLFNQQYEESGTSRVITGWNIEPSADLDSLHRYLLKFDAYQKGNQSDFHPHVSLAYGDLTKEKYRKIELKIVEEHISFPELSWTVDHVALYFKKSDFWQEHSRCPLLISS